jgi:L-fuculose-phosphate aldolase
MQDQEIGRIGRRLVAEGLVSGNFGNMSVRTDGGFLITRTGAFMDDPGPLVFVPAGGPAPEGASREHPVHRAVYAHTGVQAVVHAHPPHAIVLSFACEEVLPRDTEGQLLCPRIPVVTGACGSEALGHAVSGGLRASPVALVRGHGTFARGRTLEEAYIVTSAAEHSCRILWLLGRTDIQD